MILITCRRARGPVFFIFQSSSTAAIPISPVAMPLAALLKMAHAQRILLR